VTILSQLSPDARRSYQADRLRRKAAKTAALSAPPTWQAWLPRLFPKTFTGAFAEHHAELWQWVDGIEPGVAPSPAAFVSILARGGGKTTTAETAVVRLGAKQSRDFVLYVRSNQDKANESIQNIATKLEGPTVELYYPDLANRKLSKYGHSKGWRMDMFRCASGFNGMALGLDAAARGVKLDDVRPDIIVLDDIDSKHDSPKTVQKKIEIITTSILPAGATHLAVLFVQNLIHAFSIAAQVAAGTADFMRDRHVSGPHPAVHTLAYHTEQRSDGSTQYVIDAGEPTWAGQPLDVCQAQINLWGLSAFLKEAQHEVEESGGMWDHTEFPHARHDGMLDFIEGEVWCDPAVTSTDDSDNNGIVAGGIADDGPGTIYIVYSDERIDSPVGVLKRAILKAIELRFDSVGVETDQGGDTWKSVYYQAWQEIVEGDEQSHIISRETAVARGDIDTSEYTPDELLRIDAFIWRDEVEAWEPLRRPKYRYAKAGAGHGSKVERNQRMLSDYELGRVAHVLGTHGNLEKALRRFPNKPLDLADAAYWLWYHLKKRRTRSRIG